MWWMTWRAPHYVVDDVADRALPAAEAPSAAELWSPQPKKPGTDTRAFIVVPPGPAALSRNVMLTSASSEYLCSLVAASAPLQTITTPSRSSSRANVTCTSGHPSGLAWTHQFQWRPSAGDSSAKRGRAGEGGCVQEGGLRLHHAQVNS